MIDHIRKMLRMINLTNLSFDEVMHMIMDNIRNIRFKGFVWEENYLEIDEDSGFDGPLYIPSHCISASYNAVIKADELKLFISGELSVEKQDSIHIKTVDLDKIEYSDGNIFWNNNKLKQFHNIYADKISRIIENCKDFQYFLSDVNRLLKDDASKYVKDRIVENQWIQQFSDDADSMNDWLNKKFGLEDFSIVNDNEFYIYTSEYGEESFLLGFCDIDAEIIQDLVDYGDLFSFYPDFLTITIGDHLVYEIRNAEDNTLKEIVYIPREHIVKIDDIVVRTELNHCVFQEHDLKKVTALINVFNHSLNIVKEIPVDIRYCSDCKVYFMYENQFQELKRQGTICCNVMEEHKYIFYRKNMNTSNGYNEESILYQYGYNVSKAKGLSAYERRRILLFIRDNGILSQERIESHINWLIRQKWQDRYKDARQKWQDDLEFLRKSDGRKEYQKVLVKNIYHKNKHFIPYD